MSRTKGKRASTVVFVLICGWCMAGHPADNPAELPLEIFGRHSYIKSPAISPDGKHIAALVAIGGIYQVAVADFETRRLEVIFKVGRNDRTNFNWVGWANNSRLVTSYSWLRETAVLRTSAGLDLEYRRLIAFDRDGKNIKYLEYDISQATRGSKLGKKSRTINSVYQDDVISFLPDDEEHILIQMDGGVELNQQHVYKLNVYTAQYTEVQRNFQNIHRWYADRKGELRLGRASDENRDYVSEYHYRKSESSGWQKILEYERYEESPWHFLGFDATGEKLYFASSADSNTHSLYVFDANSGEMSKPLYNHPSYDVDGIVYDQAKKQVTGVFYTADVPLVEYFSAEDGALQKMIGQHLPGLYNSIVSESSDGSRKIISAQSDRQPVKYYLYDQSTNSLRSWYETRPDIKAELMAEHRPVHFKARDGMELHGYLTLPTSGALPPVVVYPHGGPWSRDTAEFELFAQALASRGYAALQINFRGSEGYGKQYEVAGYQEWGKKMQDDIADGLLWARKEKLVAEDRACIMGMSYGGYAALMGVIRNPELYRCAISFAGIVDLVELAAQRDRRGSYFAPQVGEAGSKDIRLSSPIHLAEQIQAPVLLMHGKRDIILSSEDTVRMAKKMAQLKKTHQLVLFENGDHHLSIEEDRIHFIKEVDGFLQKYLPVSGSN